jgi:manganese/zinc/iron transport system permease protein
MVVFPNILAARFTSDDAPLHRIAQFFANLVDRNADGSLLLTVDDYVFYAAICLGVACGVLGTFVVLRRQSLLGDAIGHAVLPGVCLGFLATGTKNTLGLLIGALVAGLLAAMLIGVLQRTTRLKSGECMGVVFTGFYGIGIVLLKYIQNTGNGEQSGLDKFLFGQIAGISRGDVGFMALCAILTVLLVIVFWRKLAISSFDESFAFSVGIPTRRLHYLLTAMLTVTIVISIQAVGVVLVSAMLVTPAATAYLLTDRLQRMVILSAVFGALAGVIGAAFSVTRDDLPSGSLMVLGASTLFGLVFLLAPRHGVAPRLIRVLQKRRRTQAENLLRTLYIMMESRGNDDRRFGVDDIAAKRQESAHHVRQLARLARRRGWVNPLSRDPIILTDAGLGEARRVVRNHRLWELFLTQEANLASDHVHADAEYIEHVLPKDVLRKLEQMLDHPTADPHGRPIPLP